MPRNQRDATFDYATRLKDAGAVTADGAAQVGGSAAILDLGLARTDGRVIVDVSALTVATADNLYNIKAQFSNSATFASGVVGQGTLALGHATMLVGESAASTAGRYELHVNNEINGTLYRYMRLYTDVAGTSPSINYTAFLAQD